MEYENFNINLIRFHQLVLGYFTQKVRDLLVNIIIRNKNDISMNKIYNQNL